MAGYRFEWWHFVLIIGVAFLIIKTQPMFFKGAVVGDASTSVIPNGNMEISCVANNVTRIAYTDDGTNTRCSFYMPARDGANAHTTQNGELLHPYDWDFQYGNSLYVSTTEKHGGSKSAWIKKETHDDWYGVGTKMYPVVAGKVYTGDVWIKTGDFSTRPPSFRIMSFYDAAKLSCGGAGAACGTPTDPVYISLTKNQPWAEYTTTAQAPTGAAYVRLEIWMPIESDIEMWIDDLWVGESQMCNLGDTRACGPSAVGVCKPGVQSCTASLAWNATCVGSVAAQPEICGNGLDENCDGVADGGCVVNETGCVEAWTCNEWGTCSNTTQSQTRTCSDQRNCGTVVNRPALSRTCSTTCSPTAEVCDGIDNDCDNLIDEGVCVNQTQINQTVLDCHAGQASAYGECKRPTTTQGCGIFDDAKSIEEQGSCTSAGKCAYVSYTDQCSDLQKFVRDNRYWVISGIVLVVLIVFVTAAPGDVKRRIRRYMGL